MGEVDFFRDTPVRYLGYANETGEALRPLIPLTAVKLSYAVAWAYVAVDTADKGYEAYRRYEGDRGERVRQTAVSSGDALVWQTLASVVVPGVTINRLCWASRVTLRRVTNLSSRTCVYASVLVGLGSIPFIVKPIDDAVSYVMDRTVRPWMLKPMRHQS